MASVAVMPRFYVPLQRPTSTPYFKRSQPLRFHSVTLRQYKLYAGIGASKGGDG